MNDTVSTAAGTVGATVALNGRRLVGNASAFAAVLSVLAARGLEA
jgi:hypothetical protein